MHLHVLPGIDSEATVGIEPTVGVLQDRLGRIPPLAGFRRFPSNGLVFPGASPFQDVPSRRDDRRSCGFLSAGCSLPYYDPHGESALRAIWRCRFDVNS